MTREEFSKAVVDHFSLLGGCLIEAQQTYITTLKELDSLAEANIEREHIGKLVDRLQVLHARMTLYEDMIKQFKCLADRP